MTGVVWDRGSSLVQVQGSYLPFELFIFVQSTARENTEDGPVYCTVNVL